jgi:hypothetical protein
MESSSRRAWAKSSSDHVLFTLDPGHWRPIKSAVLHEQAERSRAPEMFMILSWPVGPISNVVVSAALAHFHSDGSIQQVQCVSLSFRADLASVSCSLVHCRKPWSGARRSNSKSVRLNRVGMVDSISVSRRGNTSESAGSPEYRYSSVGVESESTAAHCSAFRQQYMYTIFRTSTGSCPNVTRLFVKHGDSTGVVMQLSFRLRAGDLTWVEFSLVDSRRALSAHMALTSLLRSSDGSRLIPRISSLAISAPCRNGWSTLEPFRLLIGARPDILAVSSEKVRSIQ